MKKAIGNFSLEGWTPTSVEQALMDGTLEQLINESVDTDLSDIPSDFLEVQGFNEAMKELKSEVDNWQDE